MIGLSNVYEALRACEYPELTFGAAHSMRLLSTNISSKSYDRNALCT